MNVVNTEYVAACPVGNVRKHPENKRQGDVGSIFTSIDQNGFYGALVVQASSGFILVGNHRYDAAMHAGADAVPVIFVDCNDVEARRIMLADNRTNDLASYDVAGLAEILQEIQRDSGTLLGTGYDDEALRNIMRDLEGFSTAPADPVDNTIPATEVTNAPQEGLASTRYKQTESSAADTVADEVVDKRDELVAKWKTAMGQNWKLGPHRLRIGDSTNAGDIDALLAGDMVDGVWSDPPYSVSYVGKTKAAMTIQNDAGDIDALLAGVFAQMFRVAKPGAAVYIAHSEKCRENFTHEFKVAGFWFHQVLIWVKDRMVLGHSNYHYRHEPILYGWKPNKNSAGESWPGSMYPDHPWYGERTKTTVLEFPKPSRSDLHPTTKPTALVVHCLLNSTLPGHIVLEPFGGSGTTLLACNDSNRICYAQELDPKYAAVIIERASLAGLTCELVESFGG
jgi:site-specific DNA-methyltransferase (adenine-specific)